MLTVQRALLLSISVSRGRWKSSMVWGWALSQIPTALYTIMLSVWLIGVSVLLWGKITIMILWKLNLEPQCLKRQYSRKKQLVLTARARWNWCVESGLRKRDVREASLHLDVSSSGCQFTVEGRISPGESRLLDLEMELSEWNLSVCSLENSGEKRF